MAVNTRSAKIKAVGTEAKEMLGRTSGSITAIRPMRDGVIADFDAAEKMLGHFIKKAHQRQTLVRPRVVIGVPSEITQVERRAVQDSAYRAKASEVHLVEEAMAAAIGAGLPITEASGNMIVDIGGGTTETAVISLGGIVRSSSLRMGGDKMDAAIIDYIRKEYSLLLGERTAEKVKIAIGSAYPNKDSARAELQGRDLTSGLPKTIEITDAELRQALDEPVTAIIDAIKRTLDDTPPELSGDIMKNGICLTGGGSLLGGFPLRLRHETGMKVHLAKEPLYSVVLGSGRCLEEFDVLQRVLVTPSRR